MKICIVDDEKYARIELSYLIRGILPDAQITEAVSGEQALEIISSTPFDLIFLDIHLGDIQGTTIASAAKHLNPKAKIIFVTAFAEYAVQAFSLHASDYLLKPVDENRLRDAIETVQGQMNDNVPEETEVHLDKIAVKSNRITVFLDIDKISYIESSGSGHGCILHLINGQAYSDPDSLGHFEEKLANQGFYRIHKTCLVQLTHVTDMFLWAGKTLCVHVKGSSENLPVGRERAKELKEKLKI